MTHLNIQQGQNIEVVSTNLIKKLYEAALSVPEPLEGEQDAAYMSGNLQVDKSYRAQVEYLTNRFDDLHINVTYSYYIPFEDSAVLNILLANNIGSDGIGVTEAEAANATFTIGFFENNTDITSFNTFNLFTKANTNPPSNLFYNCTNLTSIDLSNITTCSSWEFRNCSSLQLSTSALTNVTTIGPYAFGNVSQLSGNLNLPNLTGTLGTRSFDSTGISSILSLGSVIEIGEYVFQNTNISSITIPNSVKKCGCNIVNNTIVPEIVFPEGVEQIMGGQFYTINNSLTYIEIPSTVTKMGYFFHRSLETSQDNLCTIVIKATTPPELNYYGGWANRTTGDKFAGIYVPDSSLTAYQNGADAWQHSSIHAKLKPISQLQTDNPTAWAKYNRTSTV